LATVIWTDEWSPARMMRFVAEHFLGT
jgi:hypothetical protein